jgi:hypothetical protein
MALGGLQMNVNRKLFTVLLGASALFVVALSGCATAAGAQTGATTSPTQSTIVSNQNTGIWVTGQGSVTAVPDIANLSMGVEVQAATVTDALSQASQSMNSVIAALKLKGVADQDIKTQGFNISPIYGQIIYPVPPIAVPPVTVSPTKTLPPTAVPATSAAAPSLPPVTSPPVTIPSQPVITGYDVTNYISVTVRNVANAGSVIDAAALAGGDTARVQSIYFSISDPTKYNSQARDLAVADAKAKAQQLATAAGVTLGTVTYIAENQGYYPPVYSSAGAVPSASTPISPGQTQITLTVQMVFAIQ